MEQEDVVRTMMQMIEAHSVAAFVTAGRSLAAGLFGPESVAQLTNGVCDNWVKMTDARAHQTDVPKRPASRHDQELLRGV